MHHEVAVTKRNPEMCPETRIRDRLAPGRNRILSREMIVSNFGGIGEKRVQFPPSIRLALVLTTFMSWTTTA